MKIDRKVHEIANCLLDYRGADISLMGGKSGVLLFWTYYSSYSKSVDLQNTLDPLIDDIFNGIRNYRIAPTFAWRFQ